MPVFLRWIYFLVLIPLLPLLSAPNKTVCLNMIVKNESEVITRCLSSTLPIIDYWIIVDTGSTDGTQKIITDYMEKNGVPGELHERPWVNFSHNRNEALKLAKGKADYSFFIDADEFLTYSPDFKLPPLDKDCYYGTISFSGTKYDRVKFVSNDLDCEYVGALHEVLCPPPHATFGKIEKMTNVVTTEGARSKDPEKFLNDAKILEKAVQEDPLNARNVYYLAQSYRDAGKNELALQNYEKRIAMGGWEEEVFVAMLGAASMHEALEHKSADIIEAYIRAFRFRTSRVEPLYYLANHYRSKNDFSSGYAVAKIAMSVPPSNDILFVQQWLYDYGVPLEYSVCAYWTGRFDECQKVSLDLLKKSDLPPAIRKLVEANLGFANAKLIEGIVENLPDPVATLSESKNH
jgi:glycosyltransferase involved in cell wall biosynthesis